MIRALLFSLALLLFSGLPQAGHAAEARYQLRVDGLACPFCAYGIEKQLARTEGVKDIELDINAGTVTVTMTDGATLTKDHAKRIVEDAGFSLRAFVTLPARD